MRVVILFTLPFKVIRGRELEKIGFLPRMGQFDHIRSLNPICLWQEKGRAMHVQLYFHHAWCETVTTQIEPTFSGRETW